ncbi:MAG: hypothetical protein EPN98_21615 [Phenylobacterium sp.]|uniref:thermonuclease family protein n=1 Tax=Phenylobacterium sp. TaxID=1871053 RepID=UPI0012232511|nr:thermonuclease family protein [Phenylobacterium sp.]TAL29043.1 MAG: hypothetical protein EPN98_21615 [Phenylobacterium sp.]
MIAFLLAFLAAGAPATSHVLRVVDGDTFVVSAGPRPVTIRVLGIDCPESHRNAKCERDGARGGATCAEQVPRGQAATARARELLIGRDVVLEPARPCESLKPDVYRRTLAYVRLPDGADFGLELVREGLCADYGWKYPHPRMVEYRAAAAEARR